MTPDKSKCCDDLVQAVSSDEGTSYYQCLKCHKPCDVASDKEELNIPPYDWSKLEEVRLAAMKVKEIEEREKEWWRKYIKDGDYCECHDMCGDCGGGCFCWPDDHLRVDDLPKLIAESERRMIEKIEKVGNEVKNMYHNHHKINEIVDFTLQELKK